MSMDLTEASQTSEKVYKLLNYNYSHSEMVTIRNQESGNVYLSQKTQYYTIT